MREFYVNKYKLATCDGKHSEQLWFSIVNYLAGWLGGRELWQIYYNMSYCFSTENKGSGYARLGVT